MSSSSTAHTKPDTTKELPSWLKVLPDGSSEVTEGSAKIVHDSNAVFYNPIQEFNRDMSIAVIKVWSQVLLEEQRSKRDKTDNPLAGKDMSTFSNGESNARIPLIPERLESKRKSQINCMRGISSRSKLAPIDLSLEDYSSFSFTVMEALAASGLRSIRYAKEIPKISQIIANDLSKDAVASIQRNAIHNQVQEIVSPMQGDACQAFYKALAEKKRYHVVDLDPYGSAAPFLDAAVQAVANGGLLCVTCTDLAVLAGSQPESCFGKYGGINLPNAPYTHEMALRILLHSIQSTAARYRLGIEVLLSCNIDYYVRVFVRVWSSPQMMKEASSKTALLSACQTCFSFEAQPLGKYIQTEKGHKYGPARMRMTSVCDICSSSTSIVGPFYSGPLFKSDFVKRLIDHLSKNESTYGTWERMAGMVMTIHDELPDLFYHTIAKMANVLHCSCPPLEGVMNGIVSAGYKVSQSHAAPNSIKTNAPPQILWDVMRKWVQLHPLNGTQKETTPSFKILSKELKEGEDDTIISFDAPQDPFFVRAPSIRYNFVRYQSNPTPNWGPQSKPSTKPVKRKQQEVE